MRQLKLPRSLTAGYMTALVLVAAFSIGSHEVVSGIVQIQKGSGAQISTGGRQRMYTQRIALLAMQLEAGDKTARPLLREAIDVFTKNHIEIADLSLSLAKNQNSPLVPFYFGDRNFDLETHEFIHMANRLEHGTGTAEDLTKLVAEARGPLLEGLDDAVTVRLKESAARLNQLDAAQRLILVSILAILVAEALLIFRPMVSRLNARTARLNELLDQDDLTGLHNRRGFLERAAVELSRMRRTGQPLSLLMVDADHFKRVNDVYGHPVGDSVLFELAQRLKSSIRTEDIVARLGGEEFAILLPGTSPSLAATFARRMCETIAKCPIDCGEVQIDQTVSIGVAQVRADDPDAIARALRTADQMLYQAKDAGRNRVWPDLVATPQVQFA